MSKNSLKCSTFQFFHLKVNIISNDLAIISEIDKEFSFFKISEYQNLNDTYLYIYIIKPYRRIIFLPTIIQHNGEKLYELSITQKNVRIMITQIVKLIYCTNFGKSLIEYVLYKFYEKDSFVQYIMRNIYDHKTNISFAQAYKLRETFSNYFMFEIAHRLAPQYLLIHAGALSIDNKASIFVGKTHQGKTTLVLEIIRENLGRVYVNKKCYFFSDDITVIDLNTFCIVPFPISLNVRDKPSSKRTIKRIFKFQFTTRKLIDFREEFPDFLGEPCQIHNIFFLDGYPDVKSKPKIISIPPYQSMLKLAKFILVDNGTIETKLETLISLVGNANSYDLKIGEIKETLNILSNIL